MSLTFKICLPDLVCATKFVVLILKPWPDSEAKITLPSKNGKQDTILLSPFTSIIRDTGSPKPLPLGNLLAGTEKNLPLSTKIKRRYSIRHYENKKRRWY